MPLAINVVFFFDIAARLIQEYQNFMLRVTQLVKNNNMLVVRHTSRNTTCAILLHIMLDFGAQPILIDK